MRFLIAGFGSIGRRHFRNLLKLGEKDILFYRTKRSTLPDEEIKDFPVETNLNDALAHKPDAVIISNPTAYHLKVAIPAARGGCALLLEKPVSNSMDGVDDLERIVKKNAVKVHVGYQFRFHPGLKRIKKLIEQEAIGKIITVKAHWGEYLPDWHPWENYKNGYSARADLGGGVVLTLSHPLDYLRWLFGEVEAVFGLLSSGSVLGIDVDDAALISLKFSNEIMGCVYLDYNQRPPSHYLEIVGTNGTIRWDNSDGSVWVYRSESTKSGWQVYKVPEGFSRNTMFLSQMEHFIKVVREEAEPVCSLEDGICSLKTALAVFQSAKSGQLVSINK